MIRPATRSDLAAVEAIARRTDMFSEPELAHFTAELAALLGPQPEREADPRALLLAEGSGAVLGAAYLAPEAMANRVWNLLFIGVRPEHRRHGVASALIEGFEAAARDAATRLAIIETAGLPRFAPAWALYQKHGYAREARIRDYYDDGVDKLVFAKRL